MPFYFRRCSEQEGILDISWIYMPRWRDKGAHKVQHYSGTAEEWDAGGCDSGNENRRVALCMNPRSGLDCGALI